ncbi:MAG: PHP domain-containing protein [Acidobacteria bacterium]|nr:PHP domain-containing protein [Acidobacteriota bacterium]
MIDLHLHTTASDGHLSPAQLVDRVAAAGITTMSVTDHDTVAGLAEVAVEAASRGIRLVSGIEITAVAEGRDVHMLGYFFDPDSAVFLTFLEGQRALRVARVREIGARLFSLGLPVDVEALVTTAATRPGSSIGRPQLARELVRAGHVSSVQEAFERWLATGLPAFVPRTGPSPSTVVDVIHAAGGVVSFAHPAVTRRDDLIGPLAGHGLDAIEVYHSDHRPEDVQQYRGLAQRLGVLVTGGSDFHGDSLTQPMAGASTGPSASLRAGPSSRTRRNSLGVVLLPPDDFAALESRAAEIRRPS